MLPKNIKCCTEKEGKKRAEICIRCACDNLYASIFKISGCVAPWSAKTVTRGAVAESAVQILSHNKAFQDSSLMVLWLELDRPSKERAPSNTLSNRGRPSDSPLTALESKDRLL